jgi:hypothetical protein
MNLVAHDAEDLEILSARLQDAVGRLGDFAWLPGPRRFAAILNRYRWEDANRGNGSRVRAGLHFDGVLKVESQNVKRGAPDAVVSLLAIQFTPDGDAENPGGLIELQLAGGGGFRLTVECIDASLRDLTGPWAAIARPDHEDGK